MSQANSGMLDAFLRFAVPLFVAAMIGTWTYSSTRASQDDLQSVAASARVEMNRIERKGEDREIRMLEELHDLKNDFHKSEVEQAAFRAQVRASLEINE